MTTETKEPFEVEFEEADEILYGWGGYQLEEAVSMARGFRRQRDAARAERDALQQRLDAAERDAARWREWTRTLTERGKEVISLWDNPCPYDAATTRGVFRNAIADAARAAEAPADG